MLWVSNVVNVAEESTFEHAGGLDETDQGRICVDRVLHLLMYFQPVVAADGHLLLRSIHLLHLEHEYPRCISDQFPSGKMSLNMT